MAKKRKKGDALTALLGVATHKVLSELILELATEFPEVRRECFDFLKSQVSISKSLEKYKAFKKICTSAEWKSFEPKVLGMLKNAWGTDHLKICMHRREYDEALAILIKGRYPTLTWEGDYEIKVAQKLENQYPEEILKYYLSGLGNLNRGAQRKEYTRKAKVMAKVRHVLVDLLGDEQRLVKFARKVKMNNARRPAFLQEFAIAVPGWRELI